LGLAKDPCQEREASDDIEPEEPTAGQDSSRFDVGYLWLVKRARCVLDKGGTCTEYAMKKRKGLTKPKSLSITTGLQLGWIKGTSDDSN
jgi:hypothetical protein